MADGAGGGEGVLQLDEGDAGTALLGVGIAERENGGLGIQVLTDGGFESTGACAVENAKVVRATDLCIIEKMHDGL